MNQIESININPNWLYHYIIPETFKGIIERKGILSKRKLYNLKKYKIYMTSVFNGYDYISLTKKQDVVMSGYNYFCIDSYSLIIEIEGAHKAHYIKKDIKIKKLNISDIMASLPIPIRFSGWQDEYQIKNIVPLENMIGIKLPDFGTVSIEYNEKIVSDLITIMEENNFYLPFIDIENKKSISHTKIKQYLFEQSAQLNNLFHDN